MIRKGLYVLVILFAFTARSHSQYKVAIVNVADTSIVYQKRGVTVFGNYKGNLSLNFSISEYVDSTLFVYLKEGRYEPQIVKYYKDGFHFSLNKETKQWLTNLTDSFNMVIFIDNFDIPSEWVGANGPKKSSGVIKLSGFNKMLTYFSTIGFSAYRIPGFKNIEYYNLDGKLFLPDKNLVLPDNAEVLSKNDIDIMSSGLKKYLDYRIRLFLSDSYLLPNLSKESY